MSSAISATSPTPGVYSMRGEFSTLRTELFSCSYFHPRSHILYRRKANLRAIATLAIFRPRRIIRWQHLIIFISMGGPQAHAKLITP